MKASICKFVYLAAPGCIGLTGCTSPSFAGATGATVESDSAITVTWDAGVDYTIPASGIVYDVCGAKSSGSCATSFVVTQTTAPGATSATMTGLEPNTRYFFVVRARNARGYEDKNTVEVSAQTCTTGDAVCGGTCASLESDPSNCGMCGNLCTNQACADGTCQGQCSPGVKQCYAKTPQTCSGVGEWENEPACDDGAVCDAGACVQCPKGRGPAMVGLPLGYCIDTSEVTRSQYAAWLRITTAETIASQNVADCGWNTTFNPPEEDWASLISNSPDNPVSLVDWCDAYAYCIGVGKRLCGKIGGGANAFDDFAVTTKSQWFAACTSNGRNGYPYGTTYQDGTCNGWDANLDHTVDVMTMLNCKTTVEGYAGVYDMIGNVWEWEDSCDGVGRTAVCRARGGNFRGGGPGMNCYYGSWSPARDTLNVAGVGFRCCAF